MLPTNSLYALGAQPGGGMSMPITMRIWAPGT
jgi:hypothetical protein